MRFSRSTIFELTTPTTPGAISNDAVHTAGCVRRASRSIDRGSGNLILGFNACAFSQDLPFVLYADFTCKDVSELLKGSRSIGFFKVNVLEELARKFDPTVKGRAGWEDDQQQFQLIAQWRELMTAAIRTTRDADADAARARVTAGRSVLYDVCGGFATFQLPARH